MIGLDYYIPIKCKYSESLMVYNNLIPTVQYSIKTTIQYSTVLNTILPVGYSLVLGYGQRE